MSQENDMIDARGLINPIPVLMLQKAMKSSIDSYEIAVDSESTCESVVEFAEDRGYNVEIEERNGEFLLRISK